MNPMAWWRHRKARKANTTTGRVTSGRLTQGERDRLFRTSRPKR